MKAYKLLRNRKDGTIGPLFIDKNKIIPIGEWLVAEDHPTKGYAHRPGWHVCMDVQAPHLKMKNRVWCEVEIEDFIELKRPESQGTKWYLANRMKIIKKLRVKHKNRFDNEL